MSATNGIISGKNSFSTLVGSRFSKHNFDDATTIVFCISVIEHVLNLSKAAAVNFREDRTALPSGAHQRAVTFSSKKNPTVIMQMNTLNLVSQSFQNPVRLQGCARISWVGSFAPVVAVTRKHISVAVSFPFVLNPGKTILGLVFAEIFVQAF